MSSVNINGFVMPFVFDRHSSIEYLREAVDSCFAQTDPNWMLVIVEDGFHGWEVRAALDGVALRDPRRIFIEHLAENVGAGRSRQIGIEALARKGIEMISFLDADDIAAKDRNAVVRETFRKLPKVDFLYSTFDVIDENSKVRAESDLTPSILEILECHRVAPPIGDMAWIDIGVKTGYATLTSTVSVRTTLALQCPFPDERVSEDQHVWFRYSAQGVGLYYIPQALSSYRVPRNKAGSASRERAGRERFYKDKSRVDTEGFLQAGAIAIRKGTLTVREFAHYLKIFHQRMALTFQREGLSELAQKHFSMAVASSNGATGRNSEFCVQE